MGWFFTKAALVTFGGAYAVLPYVVPGRGRHVRMAHAAQMIDGLALGETTPGPLIMVVAFVGFVGGWSGMARAGSRSSPPASSAACVATWFTFLPSFVFILAGGPLIESTHGQIGLTAPLTAITAAVVGVIVNLAVFFAWHVFWPAGVGAAFQGIAAVDWIARGDGSAGDGRAVPLQGRRDPGDRGQRLRRTVAATYDAIANATAAACGATPLSV